MSNDTKNIMSDEIKVVKVECFLKDKKVCDLTWDNMPNVGMSFYHEKKEYLITKIKDSKITVQDVTKK